MKVPERDVENRELIAGKELVASNLAGILLCLFCVFHGKLFPTGASRTTATAQRREKEYGVGNHANILWRIKASNSYNLLVLHLAVVKQLLKESWPT